MKKNIKMLSSLPLIFLLSGCVMESGNKIRVSQDGENKVGYSYFLIPGMGMGSSGSTIPISNNYSITTRNVATLSMADIQSINEKCNIALIKQDNKGKIISKIGIVNEGDNVKSYGNDYYTTKVKESSGKAVSLVYRKVYANDDMNCKLMTSTTGFDTGMVGGPVYNDKNEIVGILYGMTEEIYDNKNHLVTEQAGKGQEDLFAPVGGNVLEHNRYTTFIPLSEIKDWIKDNTH